MPERRQSPRQCSTCPTSQGLPGAGGKGGPEVKDLSPAGLGLWQALFRSAASVSGKARPRGPGTRRSPAALPAAPAGLQHGTVGASSRLDGSRAQGMLQPIDGQECWEPRRSGADPGGQKARLPRPGEPQGGGSGDSSEQPVFFSREWEK